MKIEFKAFVRTLLELLKTTKDIEQAIKLLEELAKMD